MKAIRYLLILSLGVALAACGGNNSSTNPPANPPATPAQFRFLPSSTPEPVHLEILRAATVAEAENLLLSGKTIWVVGSIRAGDGGFNVPWHWHLDPATVSFSDVTIEACQATPPYIEQTLDYWLNFGQVCISGTVEAREQ